MTIEASGQTEVELEYGITLIVDFTVTGDLTRDWQGDHNVINGVERWDTIDEIRTSIDYVAVKETYDVEVKLTNDTLNLLTNAIEDYAQELIEQAADEA